MKDIYLSLGSNTGDRKKFLLTAIHEMERRGAIIKKRSSIYSSEAWGNEQLNDFLNMAILLHWEIDALSLLKELKDIEKNLGRKDASLGRIKNPREYQDRSIDIDILYMGDQKLESENLIIPHPLLHERRFVLLPMLDIAENLVDPRTEKTIEEMLNSCNDPNKVEKHS